MLVASCEGQNSFSGCLICKQRQPEKPPQWSVGGSPTSWQPQRSNSCLHQPPYGDEPSPLHIHFRLPQSPPKKGSLKVESPFSGCLCWLIHHKRLALLPTPLRPAERSILFSGKSVRLSDDAQ
ncbi:hypothetical protein, partial [Kingella oralis]|uniref:hypothetical protein n=1 Tax=Kingella oralis TaxID=505 RepID=UPI0028EAE8CA